IITEEYERTEPAKAEAQSSIAEAAAPSLLANGGFEKIGSVSTDPDDWFATRLPTTAGHYVLAASQSVSRSGKCSVVVEIADNHPETPVHYNWTAVAKGWKSGETYELSGWIKTENAKSPAIIMAQLWSEGSKPKIIGGATTQLVQPVTGTKDWTRVSTQLKVPEGTAELRIRAILSSQENRGAKAWFDDISLVKIGRSPVESLKDGPGKSRAANAGTASLISNGGFEVVQANSSDPQEWFGTRIPQTAGHYLVASSADSHRGNRSAVVEIGDNHPDRPVAYNWTTEANGWRAGETYELSGWIKTESAKNPAFIMAQFWAGSGTEKKMLGVAAAQRAFPVTGTSDWTRVSTRLTVPEGTDVVRIRAGLSSQDNRGAKAWIDDISLVKVPN
ncbi:MAG TPA: hypothetical protein VFV87_17330, partial [Pirellulaceae bacterium]|nr:hypothetical protein [Pirellulaceae bacterium]